MPQRTNQLRNSGKYGVQNKFTPALKIFRRYPKFKLLQFDNTNSIESIFIS